MPLSFQRIAYETLDVCNGVEMAAVEAAVASTGLPAGSTAVDVGTGNASVALMLAQRFGLSVAALDFDPVMAELARERIAASGAEVALSVGPAHQILGDSPPVDLITALGTTNLTGEGRPTPQAGFAFLHSRLKPGGWLLWGDIVWLAEPGGPLRQIVEATNLYEDDAGWRAAAEAAGFEVVWSEISSQTVFDAYARDSVGAVRDWLDAHPEAPEADLIRFNADRVHTVFEFGRETIGFGLYLLRARG